MICRSNSEQTSCRGSILPRFRSLLITVFISGDDEGQDGGSPEDVSREFDEYTPGTPQNRDIAVITPIHKPVVKKKKVMLLKYIIIIIYNR